MRSYRLCWNALVVGCLLLGVVVAALVWPLAAVLFWFVAGAAAGIGLTTHPRLQSRLGVPKPATSVHWVQRMRPHSRRGVLVGAALVGLAGLALVLHAWIVPLTLLVAAGHPTLLRRLHRHRPHHDPTQNPNLPDQPEISERLGDYRCGCCTCAATHTSPGSWPEHQQRTPATVALQTMSTLQLCESWCASYTALQTASTPGEWVRVVALREAYLDELEHRDPAGLRTWLGNGARVASNPASCLTRPHRESGTTAA